ncbi:hypothetical protein O4G76_04705 [Limimaricola sp. G21655-S1]|uniref:hypothetical protein n=1 Tax=Limimaricola sp. G21655-S1 TaxID=3014768 RepID=UPI0022AF1356|nr:hypothetical protein [Limimaricola sp. G21655-S1]MCZ4260140.1 hypothetical protein [Limimaricola sp. G21655-S1]
MTALPPKTLVEQQVDLVRVVLGLRRGMSQHLINNVMPYVGDDARAAVEGAIEFLDEEADIDDNLPYFLDSAIGEIRTAIAAGTSEEKVAIPRERLIGCTEAFDRHRRLSPEAEALQAALPLLEQLHQAARRAVDFAEAIRLSIRMIDAE